MTSMRAVWLAALALTVGFVLDAAPGASGRSEALRREAYAAVYNLDFDRADDLFRQAIADDPHDSAAHRGAAAAAWQRVLFLRGTLLSDDYSGHIKSTEVAPIPPAPPEIEAAYRSHLARAVSTAEKAIAKRYNEAGPHFDLGSALGLHVWYVSSIEGKIWDTGRAARRAFYESQLAHTLDPARKDIGLVVGSYRFLLSGMPKTLQLLAAIIGFKGGREEGLRLLEGAAATPGDLQEEAQFRLLLIYTRLGRHTEAAAIARDMERTHPGNRLLLLEEACALLRGGQPAEAEARLDEGIARMRQEQRPLMPGEEARWHFKRGAARLLTGQLDAAEQDLNRALGAGGVRDWVVARIRIEFGKLADLRGDRSKAETEYRAALAIATRIRDAQAASEATRFIAEPFKR